MFSGLTRSLAVVVGLLVLLPGVLIFAAEGSDWLEKLRMMSPVF